MGDLFRCGLGVSVCLNRLSRIERPIYVGIGAQTTCIQDAILASIDSTRRARDGKQQLRCQVRHFHWPSIRRSIP
jgi:hypothetical protein